MIGVIDPTKENAEARALAEAIAARKRKARLLGGRRVKYSEDQPRDERGRFGEGSSEKWASSLPESQLKALMNYGTSEYHAINSYLRGGISEVIADFERNQGYTPVGTGTTDDPKMIVAEAKSEIAKIDAAFQSAPPLTEDTKAYRGMVLPVGFVPTVGATFTDRAYVSTSARYSTGDEFSTYYLDEKAGGGAVNGLPPERVAVAEITISAGTRALSMESVWGAATGESEGMAGEEAEHLIDRGSTFEISDVSKDQLGRYQLALVVRT